MRIRFDRGTLVLEPETRGVGEQDPSRIPGAAWDDETRAWRVPAERYRELAVRPPDTPVRPLDRSELSIHSLDDRSFALPELRWYQKIALARWKAAGRRGVIALPTGSGKTLVALAAIAELAVPTLIIVPTRVLLDQWSTALAAAWPHRVGRLGDGDHEVTPITVTTYASAVGWAPRIGDRFGLVIVDEAHHVGAWCPSEVLEMLIAPARMGLTATPPPPGGALGDRIGPVVYALTPELLAGDGLAPFHVETVPIVLQRSERERYRTQRGLFAHVYAKHARFERGDLDWNKFVKRASQSVEGRAAIEAWRNYRAVMAYPSGKRTALREILERHRGERALVFTSDNATAYQVARELLVMPITYEIGRTERADVLARFQRGEASVLVSSQVLDEGFDVPDADLAIIVGGSSSHRRQIQRIGRVLRPRDGKRALIYELVVQGTLEIEYVRKRREGQLVPVDPVVIDDELAAGGAA